MDFQTGSRKSDIKLFNYMPWWILKIMDKRLTVSLVAAFD
jgi:hypothetical protein